jgi:hypothetical protein
MFMTWAEACKLLIACNADLGVTLLLEVTRAQDVKNYAGSG